MMKKLGVKTLIVTNAAGGVNPSFNPSDLMVITDHINLMGTNPLIGENDDSMGERFPDLSSVYTPELIDLTKKTAEKLGIDLQEGVYVAFTGPSYETPAEIRMAGVLGADAVGMSTVPEAIIAAWAKMNVIGISCICNSAAGVSQVALSHADVIKAAGIAKDRFKILVKEIMSEMGRVLVNGNPAKPAKQLKIGDIIEIEYAAGSEKVEVLKVPEGNVSVQEAPTLYKVIN